MITVRNYAPAPVSDYDPGAHLNTYSHISCIIIVYKHILELLVSVQRELTLTLRVSVTFLTGCVCVCVFRMETVSQALEELLVAAQQQDCLTVGVYESAKLMNV